MFFHLNGSFHSKNKEGIIHYLSKQKPGLNILTISMVEQENISELHDENKGQADYMIAVEGMTVDGETVNAVVASFSIENRA